MNELPNGIVLYEYQGTVVSVYDGDTIRVDIDLGFNVVCKNESLRLLGINAPEMTGVSRAQGIISRDVLRARILGKTVWIRTVKPGVSMPGQDSKDKYGRFLAVVWDAEGNVNEWLVEKGFAKLYMV